MKMRSTSLDTKEIQIKITLTFSLTPVRMTNIKKKMTINASNDVGGGGRLSMLWVAL